MATRRRRNLQLSSASIDLNICRPNLSRLFHLKQKPSAAAAAASSSGSESPASSESESEARAMRLEGLGRSGGGSVAVEKESEDPYLDFRHSMVAMIVENEIYSKEDLRALLRCFLHLNSPSHHRLILRVFSEIWDSVFSAQPPLFRF